MRKIQESLLEFLEKDDYEIADFKNFIIIIENLQIHEDQHYFISFLNLLSKISNHHYRGPHFFTKIEGIILQYRNYIEIYLSNLDIFNIFKSNKRILLFIIEQKILKMDENIINKIITNDEYISFKYPQYFLPEIKSLLNDDMIVKHKRINKSINHEWIDEIKEINELPDDFYNNRKKGENEGLIHTIIQQDLIKEFIIYVNQNNLSLNSTFERSNYESNLFILKEHYMRRYHNCEYNYVKISLIEYSAFYGSIQIFNYLRMNGVELGPSIWEYAIHGKNAEIINIIEENHVKPYHNSYEYLFFESIKCHHNDIANYLFENYIHNFEDENKLTRLCLQYYNFAFLKEENINSNCLYILCMYNYYMLVDELLSNSNDIELSQILNNNNSNEYFEKYKRTALYLAIEEENTEIIKLLSTKKYVDINKNNYKINDSDAWETSLHLAVEKENIEIIKLLLMNKNIDVNIRSDRYNFDNECYFNKKTALFKAVEKENTEIIKLLLMNEKLDINILNEINSNTRTAFYLAVEKENIEIIKILLKNKKLDINILNKTKSSEKTALYLAVEKENIKIIKLLMNNEQFDINTLNIIDSRAKTAFFLAVEKENIEIIKLFLQQNNLDINIKNRERWEIIRYINDGLSKTVDIANTGKTALYFAVEKENIEIIKLLLDYEKIDINAYSTEYNDFWYETLNNNILCIKKTAFYLAVEKENIDIIKLFLGNKKLNINVFNMNRIECKKQMNYIWEEMTALYLAIKKDNIEIIKLLLSYEKIDINILHQRNSFYKFNLIGTEEITALYFAVEKENPEIINLLIMNNNINVNILNKIEIKKRKRFIHQKTALHEAVQKGNKKIVQILLKMKNINVNIVDGTGKKPIDYTLTNEIKQLFSSKK